MQTKVINGVDEIWMPIPDFPTYMVSNLGNVKSITRYKKQLKLSDFKGYKYVILMNKGKRWGMRVHRLVCLAFIPNPNSLAQVNHIDGDKGNNILNNLEWCTQSENMIHAVRVLGRIPFKLPILRGKDHSRSKAIKQLTKDGNLKAMFESIGQAQFKTGIKADAIGMCLRGKNKTSGGYKWQYD